MAASNPTVDEVVKKFSESKSTHDAFVRAYERRERAYRGVLRSAQNSSKWKHQLHPPYVFSLIESVVANTVEQGLKFEVTPSPHVNVKLDEALHMLEQAQSIEYLLAHEHRIDGMDEKQRPLFLCDAIGGIGVGKAYWNWQSGSVTKQGIVNKPIHSDDGTLLGTVPTIEEITTQGILRDHSTLEVIDPRDFIIHQSARHLHPFAPGGAQYVIHRCWYSMEQCRMLEAGGFFIKGSVDKLTESQDMSSEYRDRETEVFNINRTKDLIEVLEYWGLKNGQVVRSIVGQKKVLLRAEESNPFWHGEYPFITTTSTPALFSPRGVSQVELIEALQEILWELINQRLDNIELVNNAILLIREDIFDSEAFEHFPGARWPVSSKDDVTSFEPPYQLANLTLEAESQIKGDLQNVTSAAPFAGGADSGNIDQTTATGVSIVMNNAQKALAARKYQAQMGLRDEANMRIKNCQQFITDSRLVHTIGEDGARGFRDLSVLEIQGEFAASLKLIGESSLQQERRAQAGQIITTLGQLAPMFSAAGTPLDLKQLGLYYLKLWGVDYAESFFSSAPQPGTTAPPGGPPAPGAPGAAPPPGADPNLGITAPQAIDASSPSAAGGISASPIVAMHRALALSGGANNA